MNYFIKLSFRYFKNFRFYGWDIGFFSVGFYVSLRKDGDAVGEGRRKCVVLFVFLIVL